MSKRNVVVLILLAGVLAVAIYLLKPCNAAPSVPVTDTAAKPQILAAAKPKTASPATIEKKVEPHPTKLAPVEVDNAPPVALTIDPKNPEQKLPDVSRCAIDNFPDGAKPYVQKAIVSVLLVVDRYGNVRSVTTKSVSFPGMDSDLVTPEVKEKFINAEPAVRKMFIDAGRHAFGAKKCPPYIVGKETRGYSINVPLVYKQ
jgi:hypothetical protein